MHKQSIDDELASVMDLAYFEGDFWPNVIEEQIKELDQEERAQASGEVSIEFLYFSSTSSISGGSLPTTYVLSQCSF